MSDTIPLPTDAELDAIVERFKADHELFDLFANQLRGLAEAPSLRQLYHSMRWRLKDPDHLRDKLLRQVAKAKAAGVPFDITPDNYASRINDLVGLRLLHLHTHEFPQINATLLALCDEEGFTVIEGPEARVWDDEYRQIFSDMKIKWVASKRMYTSVHYVIEANKKSKRTAEIQVRTLAEELWGEVDHMINYPAESPKLACREQIKALARVTSSATRLVDSIFATHNE